MNKKGMDSGDNRGVLIDREKDGEKAWEILVE